MHGRGLTAAIASVFVMSACGASVAHNNTTPRLQVIVSATSTETARFETTQEVDGTRVVLSGLMDYSNQTGSATVEQSRAPTSTTTTIDSPDGLATSQSVQVYSPIELRWIGTVVYANYPAGSGLFGVHAGRPWVALDEGRVRAAMCVGTPSVAGMLGLGASDPTTVLDRLRADGAALTRLGTEDVRGVSTTHWQVVFDPPPTTTTIPGCKRQQQNANEASPARDDHLDIWTDADDRLRRLQSTSTTTMTEGLSDSSDSTEMTSPPETTTETITTEFYDFGTAVDVEAPPADQTYDATPDVVGEFSGPGQVGADAWRDAAHGSLDRKPWTVWFATTTTGWRCYDVQGAPSDPLDPAISIGDTGDGPMPEHGGRKADCEAPTMDPGPEPATVFVSGSDAGDSVLVGEAPAAATSVTVVMADGTSTDIAVDPQTKLFDWSGASVPKSIKAGGTSCSVGFGHGGPSAGSGLMCNSGVFDNTP